MGKSKKEPLTLDDGLPAPGAPDIEVRGVADHGTEYEVIERDIWINRNGEVVRVAKGDRVRMLPEIAVNLFDLGLIREYRTAN